jgi:hypothetical protein
MGLAQVNIMTKRTKFRDVVPGSRFRYDGRVYLKLRLNLAKDEHQKRVMFPSEVEVEPIGGGEPRSGNDNHAPGDQPET